MIAAELRANGCDPMFADLYEMIEASEAVSFDESESSWITIGGGAGPHGEQHSGGFPVLIDKGGTIIGGAGPKELKGQHVSQVKNVFDKLNAGEPANAAAKPSYAPVSTKQGLSAEEENTLFAKARSGDQQAKDRIILANQALIGSIAKRYKNSGVSQQDLMQEGTLGLLRAMQDYDPSKGKFSTHATWWIRSALTKASRKESKAPSELPQGKQDEQSPEQLLADAKAANPAKQAVATEAKSKLQSALAGMDQRSASVLRMRYGLEGTTILGQQEIADKLGVSRQRVAQIETESLAKLKSKLGAVFSAIAELAIDPDFARMYFVEFGGAGSGDHGHAGRQGEVGGSSPSGESGKTTQQLVERIKTIDKNDSSQAMQDVVRELASKLGGMSKSELIETSRLLSVSGSPWAHGTKANMLKQVHDFIQSMARTHYQTQFSIDQQFAERYMAEFGQTIHDNPEDAAAETDTEPSEKQLKAENYSKGKFKWNGLTIAIENPDGSVRRGKGWAQVMQSHYGYIRTDGGFQKSKADGDHVDCFIGPDLESQQVFIVNQNKQDGSFDEAKCMLAFPSEAAAVTGYKANYPSDWNGLGSVKTMSVDEFKQWLKEGDTSKLAFSELLACGCDPQFAARFAVRTHRPTKSELQHLAKVTPAKILAAKELWNRVVPLAKRKQLARLARAKFSGIDYEFAERFAAEFGEGSGDWGHAGRPGEVGGSSKSGEPNAEHARVGVPAMDVPPPPAIPRLPNLTPDQRAVESRFADGYTANPQKYVDKYAKSLASGKVGVAPNVYATDDVKMLNKDWNPGGAKAGDELPKVSKEAMAKYNTAVHQTANAIAKRAFVQKLDELAKLPTGHDMKTVLVTNGGCAAGKGSTLSHAEEKGNPYSKLVSPAKQVGAVWDAAGEQNATENEWVKKECDARGIKATFVYVLADPKDTWDAGDRGVIRRAVTKGRMVDARLFADSYAEGAKNMKAFADAHTTDGTSMVFIDNRIKGDPKIMKSFPAQETAGWNSESIYKMAVDNLKSHKADLPKSLYDGGLAGEKIWGPPKEGVKAHA